MKNINKTLTLFKTQKGAALMLVLWVMVVLCAIAAEFIYSMRTEIKIVTNYKEDTKAYYGAIAGIEFAKAEIKDPKTFLFRDSNDKIVNVNNIYKRKGMIDDVEFSYQLYDEDGKLNINTATPDKLRLLFTFAGVGQDKSVDIIDSILDWIDKDNNHRINGAEEDYYIALKTPYSCKDGSIDTIEELLLVKGMTPEFLYGKTGDSEIKGIAQYITAADTREININTADRDVLSIALGSEAAKNILIKRQNGPIIEPVAGGAVQSRFFTVTSTGKLGRIKRTIKTIIELKKDDLIVRYWNDNWIEG
ncbi:MAG: general secretion pathway protein GspK [Nitrospirae bacterium]|nr:general secretion pathway protein GspK [Nitrospirota bacterium]